MAESYASVQVRSQDRDSLLADVEALAHETELSFLCGPVIDGWIGLYPSKRVDEMAVAVASRWAGDLFYLAVREEAVMQYRYFHAGKLRDAYWSAPGLDSANFYVNEAEFGDPETYRSLIDGAVERAAAILDRTGHTIRELGSERNRLAAFAKLLGIVNVEASYETLERGDRQGILRWEEFVHIPERAKKQKAQDRTDARSARQSEHERLFGNGLLLAREEVADEPAPLVVTIRREPVRIEFDERAAPIPHPDGSCIVQRGTVRHQCDSIEIVPNDGPLRRRLLVVAPEAQEANGQSALRKSAALFKAAPTLLSMPVGQALAEILAIVPADQRAITEQHLRRVLPPPPWTLQQAQSLAMLASQAIIRRDMVHPLCFSTDGKWLACGTAKGLRVAAWSDVMVAVDGSPAPWRYSFDIPPHELVPNPGHGYVYAVVSDPVGDCFVFGGIDGRVRSMSLADGRVLDLLELPERAAIMRMKLLDGGALAMRAHPGFPKVGRMAQKPIVYVWSYAALRERAQSGGGPVDPPLPPHARVPLASADEPSVSPAERALAELRAAHERSPSEIGLQPARETDWPDRETEERLVEPLLRAGFRGSERFIVSGLDDACVQFFAHPQQCITATLMKTRDGGTTLDVASEQSDGSSISFTNRRSTGLDALPGRTVHHAEGVDAKGLLYLMARHRPRISWLAVDVAELPQRFVAGYAQKRAWREQRGYSDSEVMRFLASQQRRVPEPL